MKRANEILRKAAAFFAHAELGPRIGVRVSFIYEHRAEYEVEPICEGCRIAPAT